MCCLCTLPSSADHWLVVSAAWMRKDFFKALVQISRAHGKNSHSPEQRYILVVPGADPLLLEERFLEGRWLSRNFTITSDLVFTCRSLCLVRWRELMASKQTGQQRCKYIQMAMRIRTPTPGTEINPAVCFCMLHTLQNNSCVACVLYQARPITG